jgi:uncharacterized protein YigA (DUF484 family)
MSTNQDPQASGEIDEERVAEYLLNHPGFFERRPQLLGTLKLSHPTGGDAVSLIERQVSVLREQNRSLERKLLELVNIARENEQLSRKLHSFAAELLKTGSLSDAIAVTEDKVRELFNTDFVAVKLLPGVTDDPSLQVDNEIRQGLFNKLVEQDKPLCGQLTDSQMAFLFGGTAAETRSAPVPAGTQLNGMRGSPSWPGV